MALQSAGIGSGLDVSGIVAQLMAIERRPLDALDKKEAGYQARLSAFGSMKGALSALRSAAVAIAQPAVFRAAKAVVADSSLASATATSSSAAAGSYELEVQALAQQHKLKSTAFASSATVAGSGTLTIEFGTYSGGAFGLNANKAAKVVTIAPGQDSVAAVRDALNAAGGGVSASIINDGSGARLVVTSTDSGAANALRITVADSDGNHTDAAGLSRLAYDASTGGTTNLTVSVVAQDAIAVIDGITVTSASNAIEGAIEGVALQLAKAAPGTKTALVVSRDVDGAKAAVDAFVKSYNDTAKALKALSAYDAATKTAAPLQGDTTLLSVQSRLRAVLGAAVDYAGGYASLSEVGVAFQRDGTLVADAAKLRAALEDTTRDAASAFAAIGKPSDSLVRFSASDATAEAGDYALTVTQLATRGQAAGSAPAVLLIQAGVNDSLQLAVDGVAQTATLAAGTYTADTLATMLQTRIAGVEASAAAGVLTLKSATWGSSSTVVVTGGNAAADLFGTPASTSGLDASGTLGGVAATGSGRNLKAKGLTATIEGGSTGARGTLRFSRGAADRLDSLISGLLDGAIAARTTGLGTSLSGLDAQRTRIQARLEGVEKRLRAQFSALDNMIASMNTTSSFLTQQMANLPKSGGNS